MSKLNLKLAIKVRKPNIEPIINDASIISFFTSSISLFELFVLSILKFKKKVKSVNTQNSITGKKKAIVTFAEEGVASDLSSTLGLV